MSWTGLNPKWVQVEHHQDQLLLHPQLTAVDHLNGPMTNGVTMKTTMPIATGMVALVVTMILVDGTLTVTHVNALILTVVVALPQDPLIQPLLNSLVQPPMYQLKDVDPLAGPMINGVMMKTTMPSAIMMVELVASMKLMDGIVTAQIASAKSVHHLDGMAIATVTII
jgi:hypothetical protein